MSVRVRARPGLVKDEADEERSLWSNIRSDGKRVDALVAEQNTKWARMQELKATLEAQWSANEDPSLALEDELMRLARETLKLDEEIATLTEGEAESDPSSLVGSLSLLTALRASSEADSLVPTVRGPGPKNRGPKRKAESMSGTPADDRDSLAAESPAPGPSPKMLVPATTRLKVAAGSRAGSVPAGREASVKIEDDERTGGDEGRPRYGVGTEVLYRKKGGQKDKDAEGEGILCQVTAVIGEGKQRRYEIRDTDPDLDNPSPYRASLQQMTPIPPTDAKLPDIPPRKNVLALYPGTTTFYKAEVVKTRESVEPPPPGHVRLRFEGEDEADRETDVERRYVLVDWTGK
ncbi:hypothetical protein EJ06DRAFT_550845 [Trichodelitschia bisporula]|uniref:SGF29 C-terminal domain-containing protein n=1 Tax=Trichodelitschia bisporula TaxID=703511 RepID=A0A6G1HPA9_9PEZI|nr:hypothetical protein EJ06DRAFT_550845 [Trichodelitschia bisporula]